MYGNICDTRQVHDVDKLKQRLMKVWHGLGQSAVGDTMDDWHKRLWECIHAKGGHFQHLIDMLMFRNTSMLLH